MRAKTQLKKYGKIYAVQSKGFWFDGLNVRVRIFRSVEAFEKWLHEDRCDFSVRENVSKTNFEKIEKYLDYFWR